MRVLGKLLECALLMKGIPGLIIAVMSLYQSPITRVRVDSMWPGDGI